MTYIVTEACIRCKYMDCVEATGVTLVFFGGANFGAFVESRIRRALPSTVIP